MQPDADLMAALARQLEAEADVDGLLQRVVDASVVQIDGAEQAGITIISHRSVSTPAATAELVRQVDRQQYSIGEGPCLTAALEQQPIVRVDDLTTEQRWPKFAHAAVSLGVRSMLSFQLYTDSDTIGALNIYASPTHAFTEESVHTGTLLATHAALAAAAKVKSSNLRVALASRDTIGQAKGILMERYRITAPQAFDLLIAASQLTHLKLKDVAARLTETGQLETGRLETDG